MIASLHGEVIDIGLNTAVIECAGVGYVFTATPRTLATLRRGESSRVLTTLVVREDAMSLYGFTDATSREMFTLLQSVSGLGPRLALAAQSVFSAAELAAAIGGGDAKSLQRIPGVGKRMAERMIVDLKDKVGAYAGETAPEVAPVVVGSVVPEQVVEALVGLGFPERTASATVAAVSGDDPGLDTAGALRAALARLGRG
ncbi:Holliday junction branch migration protein RuvA [Corynebacterium sp. P7003]|uniref:Holliday junction branch migration complex subunit RuvA n=1 Tax=Corynebacterium pygosceleis TaxID=2800406 RepID=A0ABT3WP69_9CORY|nr:Holliday junction branch migration protein RuvA [Corynebacterium pygosceleis]MCX7443848.1 Holliday junction branch migration protein RuvA [Corynebacterium pygosceleis]